MNDYGAPDMVATIARAPVPAGAIALWWMGQASFALKGAGVTIYIDPYLQLSDKRLTQSPFPPEALTNADVVLLTHDHLDHIDPLALPGIARASAAARFVASRPVQEKVAGLVGSTDRVVPAVADEPIVLDVRGVRVELLPTPARHEEWDMAGADYPYLGYTVRLNGVTVHHSGDTIPYDGQIERLREHRIDLALLPINGRDFYRTRVGTIGNTDYREAADIAVGMGADVVIPMHYGMFRGNTTPPGHFVSHMHEFYPQQSVHVMGRFGSYVYVKPPR